MFFHVLRHLEHSFPPREKLTFFTDSRGVQNSKKFDFNCVEWFFPLQSMPGVSTKNFRPLNQLEDPALAPYIIQRKFQNIQRKILKVSILIF